MEDTLSPDRCDCVGLFTMSVDTAEPSPEAVERWARRAELLANWLIAEWRREHEQAEGTTIDGQRRSDRDHAIRQCDLN